MSREKPDHYKGFYLTEYDAKMHDGSERRVVHASITMEFMYYDDAENAKRGIDEMVNDLHTAIALTDETRGDDHYDHHHEDRTIVCDPHRHSRPHGRKDAVITEQERKRRKVSNALIDMDLERTTHHRNIEAAFTRPLDESYGRDEAIEMIQAEVLAEVRRHRRVLEKITTRISEAAI